MPWYLLRISDASVDEIVDIHVHAGAVEAVLAGDGLPEGGTDLVTLFTCQPYALHIIIAGTRTHWPVWRCTCTPSHSLAVCFCIIDTRTRGTRVGQGCVLAGWCSTYNLTHGGGWVEGVVWMCIWICRLLQVFGREIEAVSAWCLRSGESSCLAMFWGVGYPKAAKEKSRSDDSQWELRAQSLGNASTS